MKYKFIVICSIYILVTSCGNDGRGYEYMPNMYRSPSLETYGKNKIFKDSLLKFIRKTPKKIIFK